MEERNILLFENIEGMYQPIMDTVHYYEDFYDCYYHHTVFIIQTAVNNYPDLIADFKMQDILEGLPSGSLKEDMIIWYHYYTRYIFILVSKKDPLHQEWQKRLICTLFKLRTSVYLILKVERLLNFRLVHNYDAYQFVTYYWMLKLRTKWNILLNKNKIFNRILCVTSWTKFYSLAVCSNTIDNNQTNANDTWKKIKIETDSSSNEDSLYVMLPCQLLQESLKLDPPICSNCKEGELKKQGGFTVDIVYLCTNHGSCHDIVRLLKIECGHLKEIHQWRDIHNILVALHESLLACAG